MQYLNFWTKQAPYTGTTTLHTLANIQVNVDTTPIGGFRGQAGSLVITHLQNKVLNNWSKSDLDNLATVIQKCLGIYAKANIDNVLIFGRQENNQFKLKLIPYPRGTWYEKIQGAYHVIFGGTALKPTQIQETVEFFKNKFTRNGADTYTPNVTPAGNDPFCDQEIVQRQRINTVFSGGRGYTLMHDNRPKGRSKDDPHLLIIPNGPDGHTQERDLLLRQRMHMLEILKRAFEVLLKRNPETILYIEPCGPKIQGVHHKLYHVIGIPVFPANFFTKLWGLIRFFIPAKLSDEELKKKITDFKQYNWNR